MASVVRTAREEAELRREWKAVADGIDGAVPQLLLAMSIIANDLPHPAATLIEMMTCLAASVVVLTGNADTDKATIDRVAKGIANKVAIQRLKTARPAGSA